MNRPHTLSPRRAAHRAEATARRTARRPTSLRLARLGFATKGVVYLIIGLLAAQAALGRGGATTDNTGAVETLAHLPFGRLLVAVAAVGLFAYALWLIVESVFDVEGKGNTKQSIAARVGYAVLACSYTLLGVMAAQLALHRPTNGTSSDRATQDWTARLLGTPFGVALVVLAGMGVLALAGFFVWQAITARFQDNLDLTTASPMERQWVRRLGRVGYAALAATNVVIGLFLILAAVRRDAGQAKGLGGALAALTQRPYGHALLGAVALGLVGYAAYSFAEARYRRLVPR